jgi:hypothetical protein
MLLQTYKLEYSLSAGGGRHGSNINYIRHVPKFLQGHAHLLGKPQGEVQEEQLAAKKALPDTWDSEDDEEADRQVDPFLYLTQSKDYCHVLVCSEC